MRLKSFRSHSPTHGQLQFKSPFGVTSPCSSNRLSNSATVIELGFSWSSLVTKISLSLPRTRQNDILSSTIFELIVSNCIKCYTTHIHTHTLSLYDLRSMVSKRIIRQTRVFPMFWSVNCCRGRFDFQRKNVNKSKFKVHSHSLPDVSSFNLINYLNRTDQISIRIKSNSSILLSSIIKFGSKRVTVTNPIEFFGSKTTIRFYLY